MYCDAHSICTFYFLPTQTFDFHGGKQKIVKLFNRGENDSCTERMLVFQFVVIHLSKCLVFFKGECHR